MFSLKICKLRSRGEWLLLAVAFLVLVSCASEGERSPTTEQVPPTIPPDNQVLYDVHNGLKDTPEVALQASKTPGENSQQTPAAACLTVAGRIEQVEYSSHILGKYIPVLIYLPPCYSDEQDYPVLFLLHGKPQDEDHWLILGIDKVVDGLIASGELAELILVMPKQPEPLFSQTDGGPGSYEGEFLSALVPFIEGRYAVSPYAEERAIAGISRGGVWALEIAFANPRSFAGVGGLSPALNVNDARPEYDPLDLAKSQGRLPERIYIASGDVDSAAADTKHLHEILTRRGVEHRYTTVPGGHEGATWKQLIGEMLIYLAATW
jgi:enterochelin esterase-like enzyme